MIEKIKEYAAKYGVAIVSVLSLIFLYLFNRRGRTIDELKGEIAVAKMGKVLDNAVRESNKDEEDYRRKLATYDELKRKYDSGDGKPPGSNL